MFRCIVVGWSTSRDRPPSMRRKDNCTLIAASSWGFLDNSARFGLHLSWLVKECWYSGHTAMALCTKPLMGGEWLSIFGLALPGDHVDLLLGYARREV
jgi:hypothetical protein